MKNLSGRYEGITFNTICPGHIDVGKLMGSYAGKAGKPEDIAGIATFLCSEKAKHINGACIVVDGGESKSF
jgi:NAD(P)-dependent dehydrogenase (short-subunit alcohol dehydrogenase family)